MRQWTTAPLTLTQSLMSEASDGIVTLDSALATGLFLQSSAGGAIPIERWNDVNLGLNAVNERQ